MRIIVAVCLLFIAQIASYPTDNDETNNDLELELRSILNRLNDEQDNDEQMTRSFTADEEDTDDDDNYLFSKRQGGHNIVNKGTKCEIECVHAERNPAVGKGKTIKEAAKVCKNKCLVGANKRAGKQLNSKKTPKHGLREFVDDDDNDNSNDSEEQQDQRREFYDYLMEQIQRNNNQ